MVKVGPECSIECPKAYLVAKGHPRSLCWTIGIFYLVVKMTYVRPSFYGSYSSLPPYTS